MKRKYGVIFPSMSTKLHEAVQNQGLYRFDEILQSEMKNVNTKDVNGRTPLYYAVLKGNYRVVRLLLAAGADVDSVGKDGRSLLHVCACRNDFPMTLEHLLFMGADPNIPDTGGVTPLTYALMQKNTSTAHILIMRGADIYVPDAGLYSPSYLLQQRYLSVAMQRDVVKKGVSELWIMLTATYDSYVQWLPKEMVDDVLELL